MSKLLFFKGFHSLSIALLWSLFPSPTLTAQTYCVSKGTAPWNEWIAGVQIGTINNTSSKEGYRDFTTVSTHLAKGTSYSLVITQGFSWATDPVNATQQGRAWIDYNRNGTFETTELVASFTRNSLTANILIPTTASTGATRMRIALKTVGMPTACEVFEKGEVEDYTVQIQNANAPAHDNQKLIVTAVSGNNRVQLNGVLSSNITIKNNASVPSLADSLYIASWVANTGLGTGVFYSTPFSRNKVAIPPIGANQSITIPTNFTMPSTLSSNVYAKPSGSDVLLEPYFITKQVADYHNSRAPIEGTLAKSISYNYPILPASTADLSLTATQINPTWDSAHPAINVRLRITNNGPNAAKNIAVAIHETLARNGLPNYPAAADFVLTNGSGVLETRSVLVWNYTTREFWAWRIPELAAGATLEATFRGVVRTEFAAPQGASFYYADVAIHPKIIYADALDNVRTNDSILGGFTYRFVRTNAVLPDLTLANLTIPTPTVQQGQILNWKVDIKNIGTGNASNSFSVKSYLSTDNVLSSNDIQDGIIPTANFAAGFSVLQVPGASRVATTVPAGQYYLILKVDADNQVVELSENNNVLVSAVPFTVSAAGSPCTNCGFLKSYSQYPISTAFYAAAFSSEATVNNNALVWTVTDPLTYVNPGTNKRVVTLTTDLNGVQTNLTDVTVPVATAPYKVTTTFSPTFQVEIKKTLANGTVEWVKTYPFRGTNNNILELSGGGAYEVSDGFILSGGVVYGPTTAVTFANWTIKVLKNGNFVQQNHWGNSTEIHHLSILFKSGLGGHIGTFYKQNLYELLKFDNNGVLIWKSFLASDLPSTTVNKVRESSDGRFLFAAIVNNQKAEVRKYDAITGVNLWTKSVADVLSPNEPYTRGEYIKDVIPTQDGGAIVGYTYITPGGNESGYEYGRLDANGNQVWYKRLNNQYDLEPKATIGNCGFLFVGKKNMNLAMMRITNNGDILPNCGGAIPSNLPDLKISDLQIQTGTIVNGVPVPFKFDIQNLGNAAAGSNYKIRFWLSSGNNLSYGARLVGSMNGVAVNAGQTRTQVAGSFTITNISEFYSPNLVIEIDADNQVQESNEDNNLHTLGVPFRTNINNNCNLSANVTDIVCDNKGTATTADDVVSFTVQTAGSLLNETYSLFFGNNSYQGFIGTPLRVSNATFTGDFLAFGVNPVNYYFCQAIVSMDKAKVCNPTVPKPDLTLSNLNIPIASVRQGQILNFKTDIKNIGAAAASNNFTVKSYLSTDKVLNTNDYQDGVIPTGGFAAGQSVLQVAGAMTVKTTVPAGQYYLLLRVDAENTIAESNENNNVIASLGLVTVTNVAGKAASTTLTETQVSQSTPIMIQQIAPNPADKEVIIELESWDHRTVQLDFANTTGSIVFSEKRTVQQGTNRLFFEVSQLPKGVYFVTTTTNQGNIPMKFVKL